MEDDSGEGGNGQRDEADNDSEQPRASRFFGASNSPCQQHEAEDGDGNFESVHCLGRSAYWTLIRLRKRLYPGMAPFLLSYFA
jgi:hypothetical protein